MTEPTRSDKRRPPICEADDVVLIRSWPDGEKVVVLDGVNLNCAAGEVSCLRGRSGSGKSSLLHILAGMLKPTSGRVVIENRSVWDLDESARALLRRTAVAMVLQEHGLLGSLTVTENVLLAPGKHDANSVRTVLEQLGVDHRRHARPRQLSMGERHRVAIARALLAAPKLLLLDEPTASLDRTSATSVIALLDQLRTESEVGIVVATHDEAVVALADRVVDLD
jgi:ABC-type lipoprotein export system ATPase subunit